jgi:hypothetical protein
MWFAPAGGRAAGGSGTTTSAGVSELECIEDAWNPYIFFMQSTLYMSGGLFSTYKAAAAITVSGK